MQSSDTIWEQEQHKDDSDDADADDVDVMLLLPAAGKCDVVLVAVDDDGDDDAVDVTLLLLPTAVDDHDDGLDVMMSFLWSMIICHRYMHI